MARRTYGQFCPIAYTLDLVGDRWTVLVIRELASGPRRFTDLRTALPGIAANLLTERLRLLVDNGLVVTRDLPPPAARTVYDLTDRGRAFAPVLAEMARWGLSLLGEPGADEHMSANATPDGLAAMVLTEELPDYGVRFRFDLDEGIHLMEVAPRGRRGERLPAAARIRTAVATAGAGSDTAPGETGPGETGAPVDLVITSSLVALLWLRTGGATVENLALDGALALTGQASAVRDFAHMWNLDPAAVEAVATVTEPAATP